MQERRSIQQAEPAREHATRPTAQSLGGSWGAPTAALLVGVCCAGPLLVAALVASGAGGWLAAHGFLLAAATAVVVATVLAVGAWRRVRRG